MEGWRSSIHICIPAVCSLRSRENQIKPSGYSFFHEITDALDAYAEKADRESDGPPCKGGYLHIDIEGLILNIPVNISKLAKQKVYFLFCWYT